MDITIALLAAALLAIVVIVAAIIILNVLKRRHANALTSKSASDAGKSLTKGAADTVKKAIAEKPPWLMTPLVVGGGWLFLLFSTYVLLPSSVWQWLFNEHPKFLWMPPLVAIVAQMLLASKKGPAKQLAYAILFVFAIALVKAIPWGGSGESSSARGEAMGRVTVLAPSWENCPRVPYNTRKKREIVVLTTPPQGIVSPCYIIERGYRFVTRPEADVQIIFRDGRVFHDGPNRAPNFGDTIWNAVFVMKSLTDKPVKVAIEFEKR